MSAAECDFQILGKTLQASGMLRSICYMGVQDVKVHTPGLQM